MTDSATEARLFFNETLGSIAERDAAIDGRRVQTAAAVAEIARELLQDEAVYTAADGWMVRGEGGAEAAISLLSFVENLLQVCLIAVGMVQPLEVVRSMERGVVQSVQRRLERTDFLYDRDQEKFWDIETMTLHGPDAVNSAIPLEAWRTEENERGRVKRIQPSKDIMRIENGGFIEGSTWWPGKPKIFSDLYVDAHGVHEVPGVRMLNTYRAPVRSADGAVEDGLWWVEHVRLLFPEPREQEALIDYMAHMLQRPDVKCNHALVLAGQPGIGKDSLLEPIKMLIGEGNYNGIDPDDLFSQYRPWLESVMLIVNEVRSFKDNFKATGLYGAMKTLIAAPPNSLPMNDKYKNLRYVRNLMRVVITSNEHHSLYIPNDDRRMLVLLSPRKKGWEDEGYFLKLYAKMLDPRAMRGLEAFLRKRDISHFDPYAPPLRTAAWHEIAGSWQSHGVLQMAINALSVSDEEGKIVSRPDVVLSYELNEMKAETLGGDADDILKLKHLIKSKREISHEADASGYEVVRRFDGGEFQMRFQKITIRCGFALVKRGAVAGGMSATQAAIRDRMLKKVSEMAKTTTEEVEIGIKKKGGNVVPLNVNPKDTSGF